MPHEIASVLKCRLCPATIAGPALVIGPGQSNRVANFMQAMAAHLIQSHPKHFEGLQQKQLEFMGLLTVMQYTTQDPRIQYQREWLRWQIHQTTLNARYGEDKLNTIAAHFAGEMVDSAVSELMEKFSERPVMTVEGMREAATANLKASIGALMLEVITAMRNELQEPLEPIAPPGLAVVKVG